jgi:hypothetical protein
MTDRPGAARASTPGRRFHRFGLESLNRTGVPFLVGGAYAFAHHTEIGRATKDLDVHLRVGDRDRMLTRLAEQGFRTQLTFPHWLAKAFHGTDFIDIIFNSGNGMCPVDDAWFEHSEESTVLGLPVRICPAEEMIWSKAFVQERERYDGADVIHLLHARGRALRWRHLLARFGAHWQILLAYLVQFGFVYPGEQDRIPRWIMRQLLNRALNELRAERPLTRVCRGTLLSRSQYVVDVSRWGYSDARRWPAGPMSPDSVRHWTRAGQRGRRSAPGR